MSINRINSGNSNLSDKINESLSDILDKINISFSSLISTINNSFSVLSERMNSSYSELFDRINFGFSELDFEEFENDVSNIIFNLHGVILDNYYKPPNKKVLNFKIYGD